MTRLMKLICVIDKKGIAHNCYPEGKAADTEECEDCDFYKRFKLWGKESTFRYTEWRGESITDEMYSSQEDY